MKKALSIVLSIAIILSLFAVIGTFTVSAAGTVFEVANFGAIKLSNMLNDGFQRQSRLFSEDATYVQTVTGLRQTRGWEKENASLLEVTVPDKGNNNLKVGTDVMSKYFLTLPQKNTTNEKNCTDPDTLTDTGNKLPLLSEKYTVVYIEYFIESLPDVSGAYAQVGLGYSTKSANTTNFVNSDILEVSSKYKTAGQYGRLSALMPKSTTTHQDIRILFNGTPGAKITIVFAGYNNGGASASLIRYHIPYGDNYDKTVISPSYAGTAYNGGAQPQALGNGSYKVPQYDDHYVATLNMNNTKSTIKTHTEGWLTGTSSASQNAQNYYVPSDQITGVWYDKDGNLVTNMDVTPHNNTYGIVVDLYASVDMVLNTKTITNVDFENGSYTVGEGNCYTDRYSVKTEGEGTEQNSYLARGLTGDSSAHNFGFKLPGTLTPGRNYSIKFKIRARRDNTLTETGNIALNYTVLSCGTATSSNVSSNDGGLSGNVFDTDSHRISVKENEWTEVTGYFTAKSSTKGQSPLFYLLDEPWHYYIDFDDITITEEKGISYCINGNQYATPFILGVTDNSKIVPTAPERKDFIFDGWYLDKNETVELTANTEVAGFMTAHAKWTEATLYKDDFADMVVGTNNLGLKVTGANTYHMAFALSTDGGAELSLFTAASADDTDTRCDIWNRTLDNSGKIAFWFTPNTAKPNGVPSDNLYLEISGADVSGVVLDCCNVPATRTVGDLTGDSKIDIRDYVAITKMSLDTYTHNWLGDFDGDEYVAEQEEINVIRDYLLLFTAIPKYSVIPSEKMGRTLVWNNEFDSNAGDFKPYYGGINTTDFVHATTKDVMSFVDGKMILSVTDYDGTKFKRALSVSTKDNMTFKHGYLEMRAKISATPGQWASFWLSGEKVQGAPYNGEIDIFETNSRGTSLSPNVHSWDNSTEQRVEQLGDKAGKFKYDENNFNKTEYHIFGFEWNETEIKFYIDGKCYKTISINSFGANYSGIFDQYYGIILGDTVYTPRISPDATNYKLDYPTPKYEIDYVRLYQKEDESRKINGVVVQ